MPKKRLQVTVRADIVEWVDQEVEKLRFASRSHAIEFALEKLRKAIQDVNLEMKKPHKALTEEEEKKFKELYLEGYSATLIFEMLGQPYPKGNSARANGRMRTYRIKLGLNPRGMFSKPKYAQNRFKSDAEKITLQKRYKKIPIMIQNARKKIETWREEYRELEKKLQGYASKLEKEEKPND